MLTAVQAGAIPDLDFGRREHLDVPGQSGGCDGGKFNGPCRRLRLRWPEIWLLAGNAHELLSDVNFAAQEVQASNLKGAPSARQA